MMTEPLPLRVVIHSLQFDNYKQLKHNAPTVFLNQNKKGTNYVRKME